LGWRIIVSDGGGSDDLFLSENLRRPGFGWQVVLWVCEFAESHVNVLSMIYHNQAGVGALVATIRTCAFGEQRYEPPALVRYESTLGYKVDS